MRLMTAVEASAMFPAVVVVNTASGHSFSEQLWPVSRHTAVGVMVSIAPVPVMCTRLAVGAIVEAAATGVPIDLEENPVTLRFGG